MAPEAEKEKQIQFDKQAFLISYYDDIAEVVKSLEYKYVYLLNTTVDAGFSTTLATLTDKIGVDKFTQLKTYQYNSLTPKIRLYRIDYNDDKSIKAQKEFKFIKDAKYTVEDITNPVVKDNSGIKSINWKLAGSNPVTAEKQIEVQIQFYFDSINAFSGGSYDKMVSAWYSASKETEIDPYKLENFSFCDDETTTRNYWSLLFHPQSEKDKYDTFKFRIKAIVGWEDLNENFKEQLNLSDADESIKKLNYGFFLNLIKHQFTLNEDGSLQVTANYVAQFENVTNNYNFNVLGSLPEVIKKIPSLAPSTMQQELNQFVKDEEKEKIKESSGLSDEEFNRLWDVAYNNSQQDIEKAHKLYQSISDPEQKEKLINCGVDQKVINSISSNQTLSTVESLSNISADITALAVTAYKRKYYSYIINRLINNTKFYYGLVIPTSVQESWKKWYGKKSIVKPKFSSAVYRPSGIYSQDATSQVMQDTKKELDQLNIDYEETFVEWAPDALENLAMGAIEYFQDPKPIRIAFTTFGSVVETIYQIVSDHLDGTFIGNGLKPSGTGQRTAFTAIPTNIELLAELERVKTVLGNISNENQIFNYNNTNNKTSRIKNLAFAPIEISLLKTFLIENLIKPKKETYTLFSFLKDALSTLVVSGINSFGVEQNEEVDKYANFSLASNILTFGNDREEDPLKSLFLTGKSSILDASTIISNKSKLDPYYINNINTNHKVYYNYNILYDKTLKDFLPKNDPILDAEMGTYHYTYGQDYGLIKGINFTKIDQPYLKEAKAVGKETFYLGQFRDRYNADLTMIGNNIYYPGMMLYIKPSVETSINVDPDRPNFAQISGIGGYYFVIEVESSITEDGYETKLKTIWQSDGYEPSTVSLSKEEQCKALLQDSGITSESGDPIISTILELTNQVNIEALKSEQDKLINQLNQNLAQTTNIGGAIIVAIAGAGEAIDRENEDYIRRIKEINKELGYNRIEVGAGGVQTID